MATLGFLVMLAAWTLATGVQQPVHTQEQVQAASESFISEFILQNDTFSVEWFNLNESSYALATTSSGNFFVFFVGKDEGGAYSINLMQEKDSISEILGQKAISQGSRQFNLSVISKVPSYLLEMNASRREEMTCRIYTGNDDVLCFDRETCQKSCYTVTSLCRPVAEGSGFEFIDHIVNLNKDIEALDKEMLSGKKVYAEFEWDPTIEKLDAYLDHLSKVLVLTSRLSKTPLKTGYSFCPTPKYDMSKVIVARDAALKEREASLELLLVPENAQKAAQDAKEALSASTAGSSEKLDFDGVAQSAGKNKLKIIADATIRIFGN